GVLFVDIVAESHVCWRLALSPQSTYGHNRAKSPLVPLAPRKARFALALSAFSSARRRFPFAASNLWAFSLDWMANSSLTAAISASRASIAIALAARVSVATTHRRSSGLPGLAI